MANFKGAAPVPSPLLRACKSPWYYYVPDSHFPSLNRLFPSLQINEYAVSPHLLLAIRILALYSMRIQELMQLTNLDVLPCDRVVCRGLKDSNSYIIWLPGICERLIPCNVSRETYRLFPWSYMQFYRACIKIGIGNCVAGGQNSMKTHSSRYALAKTIANSHSTTIAGQCLRHRSANSINYYLK